MTLKDILNIVRYALADDYPCPAVLCNKCEHDVSCKMYVISIDMITKGEY